MLERLVRKMLGVMRLSINDLLAQVRRCPGLRSLLAWRTELQSLELTLIRGSMDQ